MKRTLTLAILVTFILHPSSIVLGQGSLTPPPGAPAPTMKTLDQLEARTPIASAPFTISTSGSYYLTGNLAVATGNAITVAADHVTLDLNGFTISSTAGSATGTAILLSSVRKNVTVKNGHIRGTTTFVSGTFTTGGFLDGIANTTALSANLRISDVNVLGVGDDAIDLVTSSTPSFIVERCTVTVCPGVGIQAAAVRDCAVDTAGAAAITADIATNCFGESVGATASDFGVNTTSLAENCRGIAVAGGGIQSLSANNCIGTSTSGTGLAATTAHNCQGTSTSGGFGISLSGTASFCRGKRDGGVAISATITIGCTVNGTGTVTSPNKFLGTP